MAKNGVFLRLEQGVVDGFNAARVDSEKVHVLAVDDSLVDRKIIEKLLRITSFKVTSVDSGWRALQFLGLDGEGNSPGFDLKVDLIITDYCMPGMTGYDLLKKIKGSSAFRKVPVVIMSSENILARIDRCLEEGAEDFIVKPVKLSDIKRLRSAMFGVGQNDNQSLFIPTRKPHDDTSIKAASTPSPRSPTQPAPSTASSCSPQPDPTNSTTDDTTASPPSSSPRSESVSPASPQSPLLLKERNVKVNSVV